MLLALSKFLVSEGSSHVQDEEEHCWYVSGALAFGPVSWSLFPSLCSSALPPDSTPDASETWMRVNKVHDWHRFLTDSSLLLKAGLLCCCVYQRCGSSFLLFMAPVLGLL